ncbi:LysR family transcriptional regulator, partial [Vibrio parahaemolyticus]|nr:LysR family transcriptional regulator [Vibrio parahaemolyticus]
MMQVILSHQLKDNVTQSCKKVTIMELMNNELICFAAICKHLSLTEASKELGKSKAQVSRQLAALEKHLGVTLVHRTTRKLV